MPGSGLHFLSALNSKAVLTAPGQGTFMPPGSKILEFKLLFAVWPRLADPAAEHTRISKPSKASLEWLLQRMQLDLACPLRGKPILACRAEADACAEGTVGIGGWFISSNSVTWFAETWDCADVQAEWPCFETLAQLALMHIAWTAEGQARSVCIPTGTDNAAAEAGVNKLFTTAWPLQMFVQLVAAWAHKLKWSIIASRVPGEYNTWADQLSRGNLSAFSSRPEART